MINNTFDISDFVPSQSLTGTVYELVKREKAARKAKKLTQKQLAERTGVSYGSIRRFEQTGEISLFSLVKIANALDCLEDFNELFKKPPVTNIRDLKLCLPILENSPYTNEEKLLVFC